MRAEFDEHLDLPAGNIDHTFRLSEIQIRHPPPFFYLDRADSPVTVRLMRRASDKLAAHTHPDPYIQPFMPGGSLFMRNPAIPLEALFPDGIPDTYSR